MLLTLFNRCLCKDNGIHSNSIHIISCRGKKVSVGKIHRPWHKPVGFQISDTNGSSFSNKSPPMSLDVVSDYSLETISLCSCDTVLGTRERECHGWISPVGKKLHRHNQPAQMECIQESNTAGHKPQQLGNMKGKSTSSVIPKCRDS